MLSFLGVLAVAVLWVLLFVVLALLAGCAAAELLCQQPWWFKDTDD